MTMWRNCGCRYHTMWIRVGGRHTYKTVLMQKVTPPSSIVLLREQALSEKTYKENFKRHSSTPKPSAPDMLRILSSTVISKVGADEPPFYYRPNHQIIAYDSNLTPTNVQQEQFFLDHISAGQELAVRIAELRQKNRRLGENGTVENLCKMLEKSKCVADIYYYFRMLHKQREDIPTDVLNKLVGYVAFHSAWLGQQLITFLVDRGFSTNSITFEIYAVTLLRQENVDRAMDVYRSMKDKGLFGSSINWHNSFLSSLIVSSPSTGQEKWELVEELVDGIKQSNLKPNVATFNLIMELASRCAQNPPKVCLDLLREMKNIDMAPSLGSYYFVLYSHHNNKKKTVSVSHTVLPNILNELERGVVEMKVRHNSDRLFFDYAMQTALSVSRDDIAKALFKMVKEGQLLHLITPGSFYGDYISAVATHNPDWDVIIQDYNELLSDCIPKPHFYQTIFNAMRFSKNVIHLPAFANDYIKHHQSTLGGNQLQSLVVDAMFAALEYNTIPHDRLEEYLNVAEKANNSIAEKKGTRESVLIRLMRNCNKYSDAEQKIKDSELSEITLSSDVLELFNRQPSDKTHLPAL